MHTSMGNHLSVYTNCQPLKNFSRGIQEVSSSPPLLNTQPKGAITRSSHLLKNLPVSLTAAEVRMSSLRLILMVTAWRKVQSLPHQSQRTLNSYSETRYVTLDK